MVEADIPEKYISIAKEKRIELIETLANHDAELEDLYLSE